MNTENQKELEKYVGIGFCCPKFYKPASWRKAVKCMNKLIELGFVIPYNYGRGKGKYKTTEKGDAIGMWNLYKELDNEGFTLKKTN